MGPGPPSQAGGASVEAAPSSKSLPPSPCQAVLGLGEAPPASSREPEHHQASNPPQSITKPAALGGCTAAAVPLMQTPNHQPRNQSVQISFSRFFCASSRSHPGTVSPPQVGLMGSPPTGAAAQPNSWVSKQAPATGQSHLQKLRRKMQVG